LPNGQSYSNHRRSVPIYLVALFVLAVNFGWASYVMVRRFDTYSVMNVLVAASLIILGLFMRRFALRVQDRVIRLEMRLRLKELLPPDLQPRIREFTLGQLVAMRFAGDAELPDLAAQVLRDRIVDKDAIKKMIQTWEPDELRA